jgi:hypothetical protein
MKEPSFDSTPEFKHFKTVMRGVLAVPKERLDTLVKESRHERTTTSVHKNKPRKKKKSQ